MATAVKSQEELAQQGIDATPQQNIVDMGTILGALFGVLLIFGAIVYQGDVGLFWSIPSALIVFGGTVTTAFIAFPSQKILGMIPVLINAFKPDIHKPADYVDVIMSLSSKYRTGGMKRLESEEEFLNNRFLRSGVSMIVDGYNAREIQEIMERELQALVERHNSGQKILRFMAVQSPVFGMAGTLIGLIQMLSQLEDPSQIGSGLATALITTFYGIMLANLILIPLVAKLNTRTENETTLLKAIRVGVMGIHDRVNPQKIRRSMNALLPPDNQK